MENTLAPSVVTPPCASSKAWNSSTTKPTGTIAAGPNSRAPSPTPVGCEQLPVTDGSFSADRRKAKADATPSSMRRSGCACKPRAMLRKPKARKGMDTAAQPSACAGGRKPSMMCIRNLPSNGQWEHHQGRIGRRSTGGRRTRRRKPVDSGFPSPRRIVLAASGRYSGSPSSSSGPSRALRSGVFPDSSGLQQRGLHRNGCTWQRHRFPV